MDDTTSKELESDCENEIYSKDIIKISSVTKNALLKVSKWQKSIKKLLEIKRGNKYE